MIVCPNCDKQFISAIECIDHQLNDHKNKEIDMDLTCEICGNEEIYEDHLCKDCFNERAQDRREAYIEAMS